MNSSPPIFALFFAMLCSSAAASPCLAPPLVFAFGDSNTDTGGYSVVSGDIPQFPEGRTFFNHPTGRVCDGRLIIDFLCESLGTNYLTPYLEWLFSPEFSNGANFALAGSDTLRGTNSEVPFTLSYQLAQFALLRNISLRYNLISAYQLSKALYLVDIGQNDINGNIDVRSLDTLLPLVVSNIKNAIRSVYGLGGRNFWVHNTGPLGCLPASLAKRNSLTRRWTPTAARPQGTKQRRRSTRRLRMSEELRCELAEATIVYVDVFAIKLDLILNATSYGFEDPFMRCYNRKANTVCGEEEGKKIISWDGTHYTEAANAIVAAKILSADFSTPPLHFNFFCTS